LGNIECEPCGIWLLQGQLTERRDPKAQGFPPTAQVPANQRAKSAPPGDESNAILFQLVGVCTLSFVRRKCLGERRTYLFDSRVIQYPHVHGFFPQ